MGKPSKRDIESARSGEDISRELNRLDGAVLVRQNGSHEVWKLPNGEILINPRHRGDMSNGLRRALVKAILPFVAILLGVILYLANFA